MGRARAAFNAALHPRGPDGRFIGKGSLGSKVIGASERGDRSVPSPKGTAAARFAAARGAKPEASDMGVARWTDSDGQVRVGDVVKSGKSYADVKWRESGRTERVYRDDQDVVFDAATPPTASPAPRKGRAAAKMAKAQPSTTIRGAGVFSTDPEIRAAAERGIDESNRQVAASKARLAKADAPSGGRFANAAADLRAMDSREAARAYLAPATKAELLQIADAVAYPGPRTGNRGDLADRLLRFAVGARIDFESIAGGAWYESPLPKADIPTAPAKRTARSMLKPPLNASDVAVEVSNLKTKAEILQRLNGLTVAELRRVATQFNIGIPASVKGRDAIRALIADAHFGDRGRYTWR